MPRIKKMNLGRGYIAAVCFCSRRDECRIILAPNGEQRRLRGADIFLECGVLFHIRSVIQNQIELIFLGIRAIHIGDIQRISVRGNPLRVTSVQILPIANRLRG